MYVYFYLTLGEAKSLIKEITLNINKLRYV